MVSPVYWISSVNNSVYFALTTCFQRYDSNSWTISLRDLPLPEGNSWRIWGGLCDMFLNLTIYISFLCFLSHDTEQLFPWDEWTTNSRHWFQGSQSLTLCQSQMARIQFQSGQNHFTFSILPCKSEPLSTFRSFWTFSADTSTIIASHVGVFRGVVFLRSPQTWIW